MVSKYGKFITLAQRTDEHIFWKLNYISNQKCLVFHEPQVKFKTEFGYVSLWVIKDVRHITASIIHAKLIMKLFRITDWISIASMS